MADELKAKAGIDTTDFKTNVQGMNRELRILESGFRASAASLGDWASDATGLESRIKTLTSSMEIQQRKVQAVREEYERVKAESGENSRAAQDLEIKLNKETETLGKMGVELQTTEGALQELKTESNQAGDSVDELGDASTETSGKMEGFKTVLGGVGTVLSGTVALVLGLVAGVLALTGVIGGLVFSTASASADLVDLSLKTGISTTRLQEMDFISKQVGVSLDTMTGAQARLVRSMNEGRDGTGDQAKAFDTLGISVVDADGKLRNSQDVFAETLDALSKIENPAERDALAMQIFGKSALELNPLIKTSSEELANLARRAHEVGAVMSEEDVAAMEAFDDTLAALQDGLKGTLGTLATAFLPGFQAVFDQVGGYLKTFTDIVRGSDGDFGKIAQGLTKLVVKIATDVAKQAPQMLQAGLEIIKSILNAITIALPSMLTAAIDILTTLLDFLVANLPVLLNAGIEILLTLINAILLNLPLLIDPALQAIVTLANGLTAALPTLIPAIVEAIILIVNTLIANQPMIVDAALALILALTEGLIASLPVLIPAIPLIIQAIVESAVQTAPAMLTAAIELIKMLAKGLVDYSVLVTIEATKVAIKIVDALNEKKDKLVDVGKNFVAGLAAGILSGAGYLYAIVVQVAENVVAALKAALQQKSPSKRGIAIGRDFVGSIGLGGEEAEGNLLQQFARMANRMAQTTMTSLASKAGAIGGSSSTSNSFDIFGNVIVQGNTTPGSFGDALKGSRY